MKKQTIVITGCDAAFYPFMQEALASLARAGIDRRADFGILDLGLTSAQKDTLHAWGCAIHAPGWAFEVPEDIRRPQQIGLVARTALRDYFPGYQIYLWFDADAWAQTPEFFDVLTDGARRTGAAIIRENGSGYRRNFLYHRWWFGHLMATYGAFTGLREGIRPAINIGILALSSTAPHWDAWVRHYKKIIEKRRKVNLDQHAFNAALDLENLPHMLAPARCNWICTLSPPLWDDARKLFCEPDAAMAPLSILHLAGPDKRRAYDLRVKSGGILHAPLTYESFTALRGESGSSARAA